MMLSSPAPQPRSTTSIPSWIGAHSDTFETPAKKLADSEGNCSSHSGGYPTLSAKAAPTGKGCLPSGLVAAALYASRTLSRRPSASDLTRFASKLESPQSQVSSALTRNKEASCEEPPNRPISSAVSR